MGDGPSGAKRVPCATSTPTQARPITTQAPRSRPRATTPTIRQLPRANSPLIMGTPAITSMRWGPFGSASANPRNASATMASRIPPANGRRPEKEAASGAGPLGGSSTSTARSGSAGYSDAAGYIAVRAPPESRIFNRQAIGAILYGRLYPVKGSVTFGQGHIQVAPEDAPSGGSRATKPRWGWDAPLPGRAGGLRGPQALQARPSAASRVLPNLNCRTGSLILASPAHCRALATAAARSTGGCAPAAFSRRCARSTDR